MSLSITARHRLGAFTLDVRTEIGGGLTALVGPSGSGKSSLLNIIAGVVRPEVGVVRLDGVTLGDTAAGVWLPSHRRRIGYVFQDPRLFPHLRVRRNLSYARWVQPRLPSSLRPDDVIALLNLEPLLARYPSRLSGGEQQRVALGRALLASPRLLLLDEPLASVDVTHRETILPYLDRVRAEHAIPAIYVTHTWNEIAGRADQVVKLDAGRVAFAGTVADAEVGR